MKGTITRLQPFLKAAGVTTLMNACDYISTIFLTQAADSQNWRPEWLIIGVAAQENTGALIEYRLRLHGVPVSWLTRIEEWDTDPTHPCFVDAQLKGPYALWHHTHEFEPDGDGGRPAPARSSTWAA